MFILVPLLTAKSLIQMVSTFIFAHTTARWWVCRCCWHAAQHRCKSFREPPSVLITMCCVTRTIWVQMKCSRFATSSATWRTQEPRKRPAYQHQLNGPILSARRLSVAWCKPWFSFSQKWSDFCCNLRAYENSEAGSLNDSEEELHLEQMSSAIAVHENVQDHPHYV